jgi:putative ABC transport system permease protein
LSWITGARARLRDFLLRGSDEERMNEEIRFHIEMETEKNVRAGMSPREARRRAFLAFGAVEAHKEELRSQRSHPLLEDLHRETRVAARSLARAPGFSALAVLTIAIGVGASTAMFSVLDAVLLQELPVRSQEEVVVLWTETAGGSRMPVGHADLAAFREQTRTLEGVAGVAYQGSFEQVLLDAGEPIVAGSTWVTGDFFEVLGVSPVLGRALSPADDVPGAERVMVISHDLWQRHFGGEQSALGRLLHWNGEPHRVVGVLPRGFQFPQGAEVWMPVIPAYPGTLRPDAAPAEVMVFDLVARLKPGLGTTGTVADFQSFLRSADADRPAAMRGQLPVVVSLVDLVTGSARATLWSAAAAVALLLLIACVNVANLLLIRGSFRTQELAIRNALGAGKRRLMRQMLIETGMLAVVGGLVGLLLAFAAIRVLVLLAPPELPRREMIGIDLPVLLFALGVTALAALLAGLLPAVISTAGDLSEWLRSGKRAGSAHGGARALRHGLVITQVALAMIVVVSAGLLVRSLVNLQSLDMGFNQDRLVIVHQTSLPGGLFESRGEYVALQERMLERVAAIPGVSGVAAVPVRPFAGDGAWTAMYSGEGQGPDDQASNPLVNFEVVGPEYFATLEIPLRLGRAFGTQDREDALPVAVVSEAVARHTWPGEDPIGKRVKLGPPDSPALWHTVVGVVGETRYRELTKPHPTLYIPVRQFGGPVPMSLAIRTRTETGAILPQVRSSLREVHPQLMPVAAGSMTQLVAAPLARPRFSAFLLVSFGTITLLLAAVGIYGVMATMVRQRTNEIGIRMALGARVGEVRKLVLGQGMKLALWGYLIGTAGALVATRAIQSMLFGITPTDPLTFTGVTLVMLGAAGLACYVPARRASRVDPVSALRAE